MADGSWWSPHDAGIAIRVRVTPGARRSEVLGVHGDRLRVKVAAPAVEGKANAALVLVVADRFGVRSSSVEVLRGERGRDKVLLVTGVREPPPSLTAP